MSELEIADLEMFPGKTFTGARERKKKALRTRDVKMFKGI